MRAALFIFAVLTGTVRAADFVSFQEIADTLELGRPAELKALLMKHPELAKARITKGDQTALASIAGRTDGDALKMAKILFEFGAEPDARDIDGQTPLHAVAINGGSTGMAKLLLKKKAQLNLADRDGRTPLHAAADNGAADLVRLFLKNAADPQAKDGRKRTPLHEASDCFSGDCEGVLKALIRGGAEVNAKDAEGLTPLAVALDAKKNNLAGILRKAGAK